MASASTSVVKDQKRSCSSFRAKIIGGVLAATLVAHDVEADFLAVRERMHSCALDSRDMDKHVGLPIAQFDESEALLRIEELHGTSIQVDFLSNRQVQSPSG
jgi:hypothetical protein